MNLTCICTWTDTWAFPKLIQLVHLHTLGDFLSLLATHWQMHQMIEHLLWPKSCPESFKFQYRPKLHRYCYPDSLCSPSPFHSSGCLCNLIKIFQTDSWKLVACTPASEPGRRLASLFDNVGTSLSDHDDLIMTMTTDHPFMRRDPVNMPKLAERNWQSLGA